MAPLPAASCELPEAESYTAEQLAARDACRVAADEAARKRLAGLQRAVRAREKAIAAAQSAASVTP